MCVCVSVCGVCMIVCTCVSVCIQVYVHLHGFVSYSCECAYM